MKTSKKLRIFFLFIIFSYISSFFFSLSYSASTNTPAPKTYSNKIVVLDYESSAVLFTKNAYEKVYPASTTKILTAILAIEGLKLEDVVVASRSAINTVPYGSSTSNIKIGELLSVEDLLYCLLLQSGNDSANVLAEKASGSVDKFVELMNKKAVAIGTKNTHFTNSHGFHDDNHYTTAYDMALIMQYAMKNETFRKIVETKSKTIAKTNLTSQERVLVNTNKLILTKEESTQSMFYEYALGGKTGYTDEARGAFVGYAKKGPDTVIVGVFDGPQSVSNKEARFLDSISLFDYTYTNYKKMTILKKESKKITIYDEKNFVEYVFELTDDITSLSRSESFKYFYKVNIDYSKINSINIDIKDIGSAKLDNSSANINYIIRSDGLALNKINGLKLIEAKSYFTKKMLFNIIISNYIYIIAYFVILIFVISFYFFFKKRKEKNFYKIAEKEKVNHNKMTDKKLSKNKIQKSEIFADRKSRKIRNVRKNRLF